MSISSRHRGLGRGCGSGRGRGVGLGMGVAVGLAVGETVGVELGVGVGVNVTVGVALGVGSNRNGGSWRWTKLAAELLVTGCANQKIDFRAESTDDIETSIQNRAVATHALLEHIWERNPPALRVNGGGRNVVPSNL